MPQGGRPHRGEAGPLPELAEFHTLLATTMGNSGIDSVSKLVPRVATGIARNHLYDLYKGRVLARRDEVELLAHALSTSVEHFLPAWERARSALERKKLRDMDARRATKAAWHDLPTPTDGLLDILNAQYEVSDTFPYALLGATPPPVSKLYIKPILQPNTPPGQRDRDDPTSRRPVPLEVPLGKHEHLLILGDPGYGKSMLGRSLVRHLAGQWLYTGEPRPMEEAVAPLYAPATAFPTAGSWSSRLAAAVCNGLLRTNPTPDLFADRVQDVRWLIVIDGLDEIHDRDCRQELLRVLHQRIQRRGPYRLIIMSRPLPAKELEILEGPDIGAYCLEPFDSDQLTRFARNWFQAQGATDIDTEVDRFLAHVTDSHLDEVVRVPLLATIAAAMQTNSPETPLPATQIELYEKFVDALLNARKPDTHSQTETTAWWAWLHDSLGLLLSYLAQLHLDSETRLMPAAQRWVDQHRPAALPVPHGVVQHIEQALVNSGLVTVTGGTLRFIHQSVVEYLAARHYAKRAGTSFEGMQPWIEQAVNKATSGNLALFTLATWSREDGNDSGLVIRQLLAEERASMDTVVRLITIGARLDDDLKKAVVDGLIEMFHKPYGRNRSVVDLIVKVGDLPTLADRLEGLAESDTLKFCSRVDAAAAYAWVIDESCGTQMLLRLAEAAGPSGRIAVLEELFQLDHDETELTAIARSIVNDPNIGRLNLVATAEVLAYYKHPDDLTDRIVHAMHVGDTADEGFLRAAEFLLERHGSQYAAQILNLIQGRVRKSVWQFGELAKAMETAGAHVELVALSKQVLLDPDVDNDCDLPREMIRAWGSSAVRNGGLDEMEETLRLARHISVTTQLSVAQDLNRLGLTDSAANLIRHFVPETVGSGVGSIWLIHALETLLEIDAKEHLAFVLKHADDEIIVGMPRLVKALARTGDAGTIVEAARRLLADPASSQARRVAAIEAWLRADVSSAGTALAIIRNLRPGPVERLAHAMNMRLHGAGQEARTLAHDVLSDPVASQELMVEAVKIFLRTAGRDHTVAAIGTLRANPRCTIHDRAEIAAELCSMDEGLAARDLWLDVLVAATLPVEKRVAAAEELRALDAVALACAEIDKAAANPQMSNAEATHLARLRRWLCTP